EIAGSARKLRAEKGLRQSDIAGKGISLTVIQRIEGGRDNYTIYSLMRVYQKLGVSLRIFILREHDSYSIKFQSSSGLVSSESKTRDRFTILDGSISRRGPPGGKFIKISLFLLMFFTVLIPPAFSVNPALSGKGPVDKTVYQYMYRLDYDHLLATKNKGVVKTLGRQPCLINCLGNYLFIKEIKPELSRPRTWTIHKKRIFKDFKVKTIPIQPFAWADLPYDFYSGGKRYWIMGIEQTINFVPFDSAMLYYTNQITRGQLRKDMVSLRLSDLKQITKKTSVTATIEDDDYLLRVVTRRKQDALAITCPNGKTVFVSVWDVMNNKGRVALNKSDYKITISPDAKNLIFTSALRYLAGYKNRAGSALIIERRQGKTGASSPLSDEAKQVKGKQLYICMHSFVNVKLAMCLGLLRFGAPDNAVSDEILQAMRKELGELGLGLSKVVTASQAKDVVERIYAYIDRVKSFIDAWRSQSDKFTEVYDRYVGGDGFSRFRERMVGLSGDINQMQGSVDEKDMGPDVEDVWIRVKAGLQVMVDYIQGIVFSMDRFTNQNNIVQIYQAAEEAFELEYLYWDKLSGVRSLFEIIAFMNLLCQEITAFVDKWRERSELFNRCFEYSGEESFFFLLNETQTNLTKQLRQMTGYKQERNGFLNPLPGEKTRKSLQKLPHPAGGKKKIGGHLRLVVNNKKGNGSSSIDMVSYVDFPQEEDSVAIAKRFMTGSLNVLNHCARTSRIAGCLASLLDLPEKDKREVEFVGLTHDVGKCGNRFLLALNNYPAKLPSAWYKYLGREHAVNSLAVFKKCGIPLTKSQEELILWHHFPAMFSGNILGQIISLADWLDAILDSSRPYHWVRRSVREIDDLPGKLDEYLNNGNVWGKTGLLPELKQVVDTIAEHEELTVILNMSREHNLPSIYDAVASWFDSDREMFLWYVNALLRRIGRTNDDGQLIKFIEAIHKKGIVDFRKEDPARLFVSEVLPREIARHQDIGLTASNDSAASPLEGQSEETWWLFQTKPGKEQTAVASLNRVGIKAELTGYDSYILVLWQSHANVDRSDSWRDLGINMVSQVPEDALGNYLPAMNGMRASSSVDVVKDKELIWESIFSGNMEVALGRLLVLRQGLEQKITSGRATERAGNVLHYLDCLDMAVFILIQMQDFSSLDEICREALALIRSHKVDNAARAERFNKIRECIGAMRMYYEDKDSDGAVAFLNRLIAENPRNSMAYYYLATILYLTGKRQEAERVYEQAVDKLGKDEPLSRADAYKKLGIIAQTGGDYDKAVSLLQKSLSINPVDPEPEIQLGICYTKQGRYQEAKGHFAAYVRLGGDKIKAMVNMMLIFLYEGDADRAAEQLKEILKTDAEDLTLYFIILENFLDDPQAIKAIFTIILAYSDEDVQVKVRRALRRYPQDERRVSEASIWTLLDILVEMSGQTESGIDKNLALVVDALTVGLSNRNFLLAVLNSEAADEAEGSKDFAAKEAREKDAMAFFDKALEISPKNVNAMHRYGTFLFRRGELERSVSLLRQAMAGMGENYRNRGVLVRDARNAYFIRAARLMQDFKAGREVDDIESVAREALTLFEDGLLISLELEKLPESDPSLEHKDRGALYGAVISINECFNESLERLTQAIDLLSRLSAGVPRQSMTYKIFCCGLGILYFSMSKLSGRLVNKETFRFFELALANHPRNDKFSNVLRFSVNQQRAYAYFRCNALIEAQGDFNSCIKLASQGLVKVDQAVVVSMRLMLGRIDYELGRFKEALRALEGMDVSSVSPEENAAFYQTTADAYRCLAFIDKDGEKLRKAKEYYQKALEVIERLPGKVGRAPLQSHLASVVYQEGDNQGALGLYTRSLQNILPERSLPVSGSRSLEDLMRCLEADPGLIAYDSHVRPLVVILAGVGEICECVNDEGLAKRAMSLAVRFARREIDLRRAAARCVGAEVGLFNGMPAMVLTVLADEMIVEPDHLALMTILYDYWFQGDCRTWQELVDESVMKVIKPDALELTGLLCSLWRTMDYRAWAKVEDILLKVNRLGFRPKESSRLEQSVEAEKTKVRGELGAHLEVILRSRMAKVNGAAKPAAGKKNGNVSPKDFEGLVKPNAKKVLAAIARDSKVQKLVQRAAVVLFIEKRALEETSEQYVLACALSLYIEGRYPYVQKLVGKNRVRMALRRFVIIDGCKDKWGAFIRDDFVPLVIDIAVKEEGSSLTAIFKADQTVGGLTDKLVDMSKK
ncbi:MAG: tetratricopeptide repeat protein, partial [Candidatus Omnitrophota bacterium]